MLNNAFLMSDTGFGSFSSYAMLFDTYDDAITYISGSEYCPSSTYEVKKIYIKD